MLDLPQEGQNKHNISLGVELCENGISTLQQRHFDVPHEVRVLATKVAAEVVGERTGELNT